MPFEYVTPSQLRENSHVSILSDRSLDAIPSIVCSMIKYVYFEEAV